MSTTNFFKFVLLTNAALYIGAALMVARLAATGAVVHQSTYSWREDWLILVFLVALAALNIGGLWHVARRDR